MLISKRSRRKTDAFESRFRGGDAGDFPLRQYLRCRDDFSSGLVHAGLTLVFAVTLVAFGRTLDNLFDSHGTQLNPWLRRMALLMVGLFVLSVLRRLYYKVRELAEIRREMARLQSVFRDRGDEDE
jgi:hypothetical protein